MDSMPNEILLKCFAYLSVTERIGIERVCKRWSEVIQMSGYADVLNVNFISSDDTNSTELYETIMMTKKNVVLFNDWKNVLFILRKCYRLQSVNFYLLSHDMFSNNQATNLFAIGRALKAVQSIRLHLTSDILSQSESDTSRNNRNIIFRNCTMLTEVQINVHLRDMLNISHHIDCMMNIFQRNLNLSKFCYHPFTFNKFNGEISVRLLMDFRRHEPAHFSLYCVHLDEDFGVFTHYWRNVCNQIPLKQMQNLEILKIT
ncbi:hypothetical protein B4U80_14400, partial [Leptotrombidium deliense]